MGWWCALLKNCLKGRKPDESGLLITCCRGNPCRRRRKLHSDFDLHPVLRGALHHRQKSQRELRHLKLLTQLQQCASSVTPSVESNPSAAFGNVLGCQWHESDRYQPNSVC